MDTNHIIVVIVKLVHLESVLVAMSMVLVRSTTKCLNGVVAKEGVLVRVPVAVTGQAVVMLTVRDITKLMALVKPTIEFIVVVLLQRILVNMVVILVGIVVRQQRILVSTVAAVVTTLVKQLRILAKGDNIVVIVILAHVINVLVDFN